MLIGGMALAGPGGILAWSENVALLEERETQIAGLQEERDILRNRVDRLDPGGADPDLAAELVRRNLNVLHPDEYVIMLDRDN